MKIRKALEQGLINIPDSNIFFNSEQWFLFCKDKITPMLSVQQGNREIFPHLYLNEDTGKKESNATITTRITNSITVLFLANSWKYKHLYDLYSAEYNPIWNYDGTEERTLTRTETGTKDVSDSKTGDDTVGYNGTETNTKEGSVTEMGASGVQQQRTTFDSAIDYDTDKTTEDNSKATVYGVRRDPVIGGDISDPMTETKSFTGRTDKTTYNSTLTTDEDTTHDTIEKETVKRGGNQGTTTTQAMFKEEMEVANTFSFLAEIVRDVANCISYI